MSDPIEDAPHRDRTQLERFESPSANIVRRNRRLLLGSATPVFLAMFIALAAVVVGDATFLAIGFPLLLLGGLSVALTYRANLDPEAEPGAVSADAAGVHRGGECLIPRAEIEAGFVAPGSPPMVRLFRRGVGALPVRIAVKDVEEGRALLHSLGLDASQSVGELRAGSQLLEWSPRRQVLQAVPILAGIGMVGASIAAQSPWLRAGVGGLALLTILGGLVSILAFGTSRTRVLVGADGVATRWLNQEAFHPFSEISAVRRYQREAGGRYIVGVELVRKDGSAIRIPCGQEGWTTVDPSEIEERIREAFEQHRGSAAGPSALAMLGRGEQPIAGWIASLRALGAGANADMRTAPVDPVRLLRIAEDASAEPRQRAAAAIAAVHGLGAEARARIRIASDTTVSPALRTTLSRIAQDESDDQAIADALAALEATSLDARGPAIQSDLSRTADEP